MAIKRAAIWGEWLLQHGETVTDFAYAGVAETATTAAILGRPSLRNPCWFLGGEYTHAPVTLRDNFSEGNWSTIAVIERTRVIGVGVALRAHLIVFGELVFWNRHAPEGIWSSTEASI